MSKRTLEPNARSPGQTPGDACFCPQFTVNSSQQQLQEMNAHCDPAIRGQNSASSMEDRLRLVLAAGQMGLWELELGESARLVLSPELLVILGVEDRFDGNIRTFLRRVHPEDRKKIILSIVGSVRNASNPELEFRFLRKGNTTGWLLARGRVYCDDQGRPIRLVGAGIDVTSQKMADLEILRLNAELERRVAERTTQLQSINKELEAFCYSVSHDLRAPLRSIRGFNEVLLERYSSNLDARGQEFLRRACESSRYMDGLIDDLLKLSRVGRCELSRREARLSELAGLIAKQLQRSDPKRRVTFHITPGLRAFGDENLLRIALDNLLHNAWKFTSRQPSPRIEFGVTSSAERAFFVRDNGAGFDSAYADRLFGVFQRLHSNSEFTGTGVGLATVQRIINRHGGRVWAEGEVDCGAAFYFVLPADESL